MNFPIRAVIVASTCRGVRPPTSTSLISGMVILPSGRTTTLGTDASGSFQIEICKVSPEPIR